MQIAVADIDKALTPAGLSVLGVFKAEAADGLTDAGEDCSVALVGNAGPGMWRVFSSSVTAADGPDPLDGWTRRVLSDTSQLMARRFDTAVRVLFPFDGPPYLPFQHWALRTGTAHPSPIATVIHDQYGLWHAYRGAFVIAAPVQAVQCDRRSSPCPDCAEKPCLAACPAGAFSARGYDLPACLEELKNNAESPCPAAGCLARRACPVGRRYAYGEAQARFHMAAFIGKTVDF